MAETKIIQATVSNNIVKRIKAQPEKTSLKLSDSRIISLLIEEALNAREAKKNKKWEPTILLLRIRKKYAPDAAINAIGLAEKDANSAPQ